MTTKTKTFDCVAMKNRIQQKMREEYEAHKDEYASYAEFLRASLAKSEWGATAVGPVSESEWFEEEEPVSRFRH